MNKKVNKIKTTTTATTNAQVLTHGAFYITMRLLLRLSWLAKAAHEYVFGSRVYTTTPAIMSSVPALYLYS